MKNIFMILILTNILILAQTSGHLKRDDNYNHVVGYYDSDADMIKNVTPSTPMPVIDLKATGYYGATIVDSTATVTGNFHAIQVIQNCVIDSLESVKLTGDPHGLSLTNGTTLLLDSITKIKISSGKIWAYKSE